MTPADLEAMGVRVKPLEWEQHPTARVWRAHTYFGTYKVFDVGGVKPTWDFDGWDRSAVNEVAQNQAAAIAAANAHLTLQVAGMLERIE